MSGGAESEVEGEGTQNFTEEAADELLKSDTEEMDCEDASYSPSSPSLSDSFHSSKSHNDDSYSTAMGTCNSRYPGPTRR